LEAIAKAGVPCMLNVREVQQLGGLKAQPKKESLKLYVSPNPKP